MATTKALNDFIEMLSTRIDIIDVEQASGEHEYQPEQVPIDPKADNGFVVEDQEQQPDPEREENSWFETVKKYFVGINETLYRSILEIIDMLFNLGALFNNKPHAQGLFDTPIQFVSKCTTLIYDKIVEFVTGLAGDVVKKIGRDVWECVSTFFVGVGTALTAAATKQREWLVFALEKLVMFIVQNPILAAPLGWAIGVGIGKLILFIEEIYLLWVNRKALFAGARNQTIPCVRQVSFHPGEERPEEEQGTAQVGVGTSLMSILDILGSILDPKFWSSIDKSCKVLNTLYTTSGHIYTVVVAIFTYYTNYLISLEIGIPVSQVPAVATVRNAQTFIEEYNALMTNDNILACRMQIDMRPKFMALEKLGESVIQSLPTRTDPSVRAILTDLKNRVTRVVIANQNLPQGDCAERAEPVAIVFMGPPGIGKTIAMETLKKGLSKRWGVPNRTLVRNPISDYWSDFCGQDWCQFDDLQQKIATGGDDKELFELVQVINTAQHLMPVEIAEQKCSAYANFQAVFITTNRRHFDTKGIYEAKALLRRLHFKVIPNWACGVEMTSPQWKGYKFRNMANLNKSVPLKISDLTFSLLDDDNRVMRSGVTYGELIELMTERRARHYQNLAMAQAQGHTLEELKSLLNAIEGLEPSDKISEDDVAKVALMFYLRGCSTPSGKIVIAMLIEQFPQLFEEVRDHHVCPLDMKTDATEIARFIQMTSTFALKGEISPVPIKGLMKYGSHAMSFIFDCMLQTLRTGKCPGRSYLTDTDQKIFTHWYKSAIMLAEATEEVKVNSKWWMLVCILEKLALGALAIKAIMSIYDWFSPNVIEPTDQGQAESGEDYNYAMHMARQVKPRGKTPRWSRVPKILTAKAEGGYDQRCLDLVTTVTVRNAVFISAVVVKEGSSPTYVGAQYGLFVKGRMCLVNLHFLRVIKKCTYIEYGNENNKATNRCTVEALGFWEAPAGDYGLIFVGHGPMYRDITVNFVDEEELVDIRHVDIVLCKPANPFTRAPRECAYGKALLSEKGVPFVDDFGNAYRTTTHLEYQLPTKAGDCGSVVFLQNCMLTGKIFGIHAMSIGPTRNCAQVVPRQCLLEGLDSFDDPQSKVCQMKSSFADIEVHPSDEVFDIPQFNFVGNVDKQFATAVGMGSTSLQATALQPVLLKGSYLPSVAAAKTLPAGEDIVLRNLKDKHQHNVTGLKADYDLAWQALTTHLNEVSRDPELDITTLTYVEALDGIAGQPNVDRLVRNTSPGWPDGKIFKTADKRFLDKAKPRAEMEKSVMAYLDDLKIGVPDMAFTLFAKDELLSAEKIQQNKVRLVYGCPTHVTIAFRMLFGPFAAWIMANHTTNGVCVGINPFGNDWNKLAQCLLSKGNNLFDADIKRFDHNQTIELLHGFVELVNLWADDDAETQRMRIHLWTSMMNAGVIYGTRLFQRVANICSGCPVTAIVNSLITIVYFLVAWIRIHRKMNAKEKDPMSFFKYCYLATFGDDNNLSVMKVATKYFNPRSIVDSMDDIGVVLTAADKGQFVKGEHIPWRTITEISFLKRSFRFDNELNRYVSPLTLDSIKKMLCWVRKSKDQTSAWRVNIANACVELSQHPIDVYNSIKDTCNLELSQIGEKRMSLQQYRVARVALESRSLESYYDFDQEDDVFGIAQMDTDPSYVYRGSYSGVNEGFPAYPYTDECTIPVAPHDCRSSRYPCDFDDCLVPHCDFDVWMEENEIYQCRTLLPVLADFHVHIDRNVYNEYLRHADLIAVWYFVYNSIGWSRPNYCKLVVPQRMGYNKETNHGELGWAWMNGPETKGHAQMQVAKEQQQIITFVNDNSAVSSMKEKISNNRYQIKDIKESREHNIVDFLERPIDDSTIPIAVGTPEMTVLASWTFPNFIYTKPLWKDKLKNFRFFRADMCLRLKVNASPFAVGYMILFYSPFNTEAGIRGWNGTLTNATGYDHVRINIGQGCDGELVVPFTSPFSAYDQADASPGEMGEFILAMMIPYQNVSGQSCSVRPYVSLRNVVVSVPTDTSLTVALNSDEFPARVIARDPYAREIIEKVEQEEEDVGHAQMFAWDRDDDTDSVLSDDSEWEEQEKNKSRTVSTILSATSKALGAFGIVPVVGPLASLGSALLTGAAGIAKYAGYAKENNLAAGQPIFNLPGARFTNAVGLDDSVVLATHPQNRVAHDSCLFSTGKDEMAILTVVAREAVVHRFTVNKTDPSRAIVFCIPVMPGYCQTPTGSVDEVDSTPVGFVSSMHEFWRGGLRYTVLIAKNAFCNFRLCFAFVPGLNTTQITTGTVWEAVYRVSHDFKDSDTFTVEIPYQSPLLWTKTLIGTDSSNSTMWGTPEVQTGSFVCYIDNPLQASDMTPESIGGVVYISGAKSIRFARPTFNEAYIIDTTGEPMGRAQSGTFATESASAIDTQTRLPPDFVSLKTSELRAQYAEAACMGESVVSLREIAKRFGKFLVPLTGFSFWVDTAYFGTWNSVHNNVPLWYISNLYRFYRGGQRFKVLWDPTNVVTDILPKKVTSAESLVQYVTPPFAPGALTGSVDTPAGFSSITYPALNPVHEVNACYYRQTPISIITTVATNVNNTRPVVSFVVMTEAASTSTMQVLIAASDDFQFGWQVGTPRLKRV